MKTNPTVSKAEQIIAALLEHGSREKAAAALGISPSTIWRWQQKPEFQEQYSRARGAVFSRAMGRLQQAADIAVTTVLTIMVGKDQPAASRVRAAASVLNYATETYMQDLQARVEALEDAKKTSKADGALPDQRKRATGKEASSAARQEGLIVAILEHGSYEKAALALGISAATVRRRVKQPHFQKQYSKARREKFSTCIERLLNAASPAITVLMKSMGDTNTRASTRLQAADTVLERAYQNLFLEDWAARIEDLESDS